MTSLRLLHLRNNSSAGGHRRLQRDHHSTRNTLRRAEIPAEDEEHLWHLAAVHVLQACAPVHSLTCGLQSLNVEAVKAIDQRAVLRRNVLPLQRASLKGLTIEPVDLRGHILPAIDQSISCTTLLWEESQIVAEGIVLPAGEPEIVTAGRVATERTDAIVLGRTDLPAVAVRRLDDEALEVVAEAAVEFRKPSANRVPASESQTRGRGRDITSRPSHRAIRCDRAAIRKERARCRDCADDPVLRVLQHKRVGLRAIQTSITEHRPEHIREGLVLAEVPAARVQNAARVDAPLRAVGVPEETNQRAVMEGLHTVRIAEGL